MTDASAPRLDQARIDGLLAVAILLALSHISAELCA
jgi:hypothetical protein